MASRKDVQDIMGLAAAGNDAPKPAVQKRPKAAAFKRPGASNSDHRPNLHVYFETNADDCSQQLV